ncbi:unnamed protein product [Owenia fusiformis]|uniref:L-2-hydroxyglutarate dehydrogenase, mitochondrial n=1 Tax=Owenia fusiformis TaxID=6347 RepID=A0A8J1XXB7_OWEFU|nr:unnamed protein product [Owenia fusiformis]
MAGCAKQLIRAPKINVLNVIPAIPNHINSQKCSQNRCLSTQSTAPKNKGKYDIAIVGGGIVGMATARQLLLNHPELKLVTLEKEDRIAAHQSGHNSGVIHAGIYYTPGSLKAKLCVSGLKMAYEYCAKNNIPYKKCGKLVVATNEEENSRLGGLFERGLQNEVPDLKLIGPDEIKKIEPFCKGLRAIHSPITGIVDWGEVTVSYGTNFKKLGGEIMTNFEVSDFKMSQSDPDYPVTVIGAQPNQEIQCKYVLTCGGLQADRIAAKSGCNPEPKILPFRGDYLLLKPEAAKMINGNIYPVPNPNFPFLGIHFTPRMNGDVWLGPNAVLAFKREGYKLLDFNARDFVDAVSFRGLQKLVMRNMGYAFGELYRGFMFSATVKASQRFVPDIRVEHVTRGPSGVRAQALDRDGGLVDDFVFDSGEGELGSRMLHVRNSPSPAATASLAIGEMIAQEVKNKFLV